MRSSYRPSSTLTLFSVLSITLLFGLGLLDRSQASPPTEDDPPVEKTYKNIKVLQGLPGSQLRPVMSLMATSLGVDCSFCHVQEENHKWVWESDANPHKDVARRMITMTREINQNFFKGRTVVTCNTCHRGSEHPVSIPSLERMGAVEEDDDAAMPAVDSILAAYQTAIGGTAALAKLQSRVISGNQVTQDGRLVPVEIRQRRPDFYSLRVAGANGAMSRGYNGRTGWSVNQRGARELAGAELAAMRRESAFLSDLTITPGLTGLRVRASDSVNGRSVWMVEGRIDSTTRQRFWFDRSSGLLLRRLTLTATPIGEIPQQIDYDDYRPADGILYPYSVRIRTVDQFSGAYYRFENVRHNVTLPDSVFAAPGK